MEFFSLCSRSDCTLINRRYQAGLSLFRVLQLLTWSPLLCVPAADAQGGLADIYSCWDSLAVRKGLSWALLPAVQQWPVTGEENRDTFVSKSGLSPQELMDRSGFFSQVGRGWAVPSSPSCLLSVTQVFFTKHLADVLEIQM